MDYHFQVHKEILAAHSPLFQAIFGSSETDANEREKKYKVGRQCFNEVNNCLLKRMYHKNKY